MKHLLLCVCLLSLRYGHAQKCATPLVVDQLKQQSNEWAAFYDQMPAQFYASGRSTSWDTTWFVQVVFHVVYNTPEQNLPDSVLFNQLDILNACYNRTNADTVNMRPVFDPVTGLGTGIRFELASVDPAGNPTNGITRTATSTATFFDIFSGGLAEGVKQTAQGGIDPWDTQHYMNVWICNMAIPIIGPSILGYAVPPPGLPNWDPGATTGIADGIVIQYQVFGNNNPNPLVFFGGDTILVDGKTLVHETGHYLGLRHIWGDEANCTGNDGIDDTPSADAASNQDCDATKNTCVDAIGGVDLPDMIENYMDYSEELCQNSFTNQQSLFMRWVLAGFRPDIARPSLTGINRVESLKTNLFPNPASNQIQFENLQPNSGISLISLDGRVLMHATYRNESNFVLDISDIPSGIYMVQIAGGSQNEVYKLVKQ